MQQPRDEQEITSPSELFGAALSQHLWKGDAGVTKGYVTPAPSTEHRAVREISGGELDMRGRAYRTRGEE